MSHFTKLQTWLENQNALMLWSTFVDEGQTITMYKVGTGLAIVIRYHRHEGWEIYTSPDTVDIGVTFKDAEARLGLRSGYPTNPATPIAIARAGRCTTCGAGPDEACSTKDGSDCP